VRHLDHVTKGFVSAVGFPPIPTLTSKGQDNRLLQLPASADFADGCGSPGAKVSDFFLLSAVVQEGGFFPFFTVTPLPLRLAGSTPPSFVSGIARPPPLSSVGQGLCSPFV